MKLVPWRKRDAWMEPFAGFEELENEISHLFDFPLTKWPARGLAEAYAWGPAVDIHDAKDHVLVKADVPGLSKDEIDVSIENDQLILKGQKKEEREEKDKNFIRKERFYGSFERIIQLPAAVDAGKVKAVYKNGVLELTLPKREELQPKKIDVQCG